MAKFKKGDRVRCVERDYSGERFYEVGEEVVVGFGKEGVFYDATGGIFYNSHWELATPSPIPDTVTIGGVEYVRKPEREFKYGDWVKTHDKKTVGFVLGHNYNKVACAFNDGEISWYSAHELTYLGTATIPE